MNPLESMEFVILCGGLGTRIRSLFPNIPKSLIPVGAGGPFLENLIENLIQQGAKKIILCVGYLKEEIIEHFQKFSKNRNIEILFSEEEEPLGTGGAIKNALPKIQGSHFFILNGDSFCDISFDELAKTHFKYESEVTLVLTNAHEEKEGGLVEISESGQIISFQQNPTTKGSYLNAGIYLLQKDLLKNFYSSQKFSLEKDFFPFLIHEKKRIFSFLTSEKVYDIGTVSRYKAFSSKLFPSS